MKILTIRGCNLTSLAGDFELRLTDGALRGAGVFAITGPVGAGKSTLLDALCLALFDKTPRFHTRGGGVQIGRADEDEKLRIRANDVRSVLRRGTGSGFAEVEFEGVDQIVYRARWSVRRARGRVDGAIQAQEVTLQERDTERRFGGTRTEVLEAIQARVGLSFEQFCRSVLLAQGDFARFLKADDRDRAELLERMTGTELYGELSKAAFRRHKEAVATLTAVRDKAAECTVLPDEERAGLEAERAQVQAVCAALDRQRQAAETAMRGHEEQARLDAEVAAGQEQVEVTRAAVARAAATGAEQAAKFAANQQRYLERVEPAAASAAAQRTAAEGWLERHAHLETLATQWDRWVSVLQRFRQTQIEAKAADQGLVEAERDARRVAGAKAAAVTARDEAARVMAAAEKEVEAARAALAGEDQQAVSERLTALDAELEMLRGVEAVFVQMQRIEADAARAQARSQEAGAAAQAAVAAAESAGRELVATRARLDEAERALRDAERIRSLEQHRAALEPGTPCPLCGAEEHPFAVDGAPAWTDRMQERVETLREEASRQQMAVAAASRDRETQSGLQAGAVREIERCAAELAAERGRLRPEHPDLPSVLAARDAARARRDAVLADQKRIEARQRTVAAATEACDAARTEWLATRDAVASIETEALAIETRISTQRALRASLARTGEATAAELEPVFADRAHAGWRARLELHADGFFAACQKQALEFIKRGEIRVTAARQEETLVALGAALQALRDEVTEARFEAALQALTECGDWGDADALREDLQREMRRREIERDERERLAEAHRTAVILHGERHRRREAHVSSARPETSREESSARVEQLRAETKVRTARREELSYALRRDDEARATRAALGPEIARLEAAAAAWEQMDQLIGHHDGVTFRVFAQSLTLDCVLESANHHLRDLAPRYQLQRVPGHDLDLQVLDLDMGEDVRSVNSLSGGESFLLSLALALGLSSVSAATTRVESLFVDEGFGSLDLQTLDMALATLDALQASGRQVGVISHVAGIAERIGAQVQVLPVGPGKSRVVVGESFEEQGAP